MTRTVCARFSVEEVEDVNLSAGEEQGEDVLGNTGQLIVSLLA